jgi:hypothetical protein
MKQLTVSSGVGDFTFYDNQNNIILNKFEGFEFADIKSTFDEVASNKVVFAGSKFGRRRISWSGDFVGDDIFTLRRQMLAVMNQTNELKTIQFTTYDNLELQCEAEIVKILNPYTHSIHSYLIEAIAPDWRFYSQALHSTEIITDELINNAGNEKTDLTIAIYGPVTNPVITNYTTGDSFELAVTLTEGQVVSIDTKLKTVLLSTANYYRYFSGDFINLIAGNNDIELDYDEYSEYDENTKLVISWRDAYRGI